MKASFATIEIGDIIEGYLSVLRRNESKI